MTVQEALMVVHSDNPTMWIKPSDYVLVQYVETCQVSWYGNETFLFHKICRVSIYAAMFQSMLCSHYTIPHWRLPEETRLQDGKANEI